MIWDNIIAFAIHLGVTLLVSLLVCIYNYIKSKLTERQRKIAENIATVVEQLYDGASSDDKLQAFKELAKRKGINVARAVEYLEQHIIPTSKSLNVIKDKNDSTDERTPEITD